ncbi:ZIP family metal transporter [Prosthecomicrobium sp. N25]|uniref:ZIP family metal transporter n=1 Tax=Prosthecomicrobium sp. N25 TaxID=3129254 RepID=UPI0030785610
MPIWAEAALWGLVGGSALVAGALVAWWVQVPARLVAAVMAAGSGILISAVSFDLMDEALARGGFAATALGFLGGAAAYTAANVAIVRRGGAHRKRSGTSEGETQRGDSGSGLAIAIGALMDGIPESVVIGASLLEGTGVSLVTVAAVFLSNLPEGLSSAAGMLRAGRSPRYVFTVWVGIALASGAAALLGNVLLAGAAPAVIAATTAVAAGAILAMLADTMIPEAFERTHEYAGLITVCGFLAAFLLTKIGDEADRSARPAPAVSSRPDGAGVRPDGAGP